MSVNNIALGTTQNPYQEIDLVLAAGETIILNVVYNYFRVLNYTGTADSLRVRFGDNPAESRFSGGGVGVLLDKVYDRVALRNTDAFSITIRIGICLGRIDDFRLSFSGTVNATGQMKQEANQSFTRGQIAIGTTAVLISAAATTKAGTTINAGGADLYIGEVNTITTSTGFLLPANGILTLTNKADIYGIRAVAAPTPPASYIIETL